MCDTSGDCADNKCSPGWFGYKCQYRDLMDLSNLQSNKMISDHNDETCQLLDNDYIIITWVQPKVFTWLRIVVKNESTVPLTDLKIWYKKYRKIEGQFLPCQNQRFFLINSRTIDVWCDFNETFQMLKLTGKVNFSICTLNVNGGRNVALKQRTAQSSTYMSPKYKKDVSQSSNAVDGKLDVKYFTFKEGSCARTALGDNNSIWSVQFLPHRITEYVLYGRRDSDDLFGFTLTTFPKTDKSFTFKNTVKEQSKIYKIVDPRKNLVSNVTITRQTVLKFCEVEIYGECPTGTWGLDCSNCSQHCPNECHVEDGRCFNLCLGFTNPPFCDL
ncbi:multiple epidermal growth factor domains protein 11, partial [Biomphalaria glabrata]